MVDSKPGTSPLFAQKGAAVPSPAVAYVGLHQMRGQPDRREPAPERRRAPDMADAGVAADPGTTAAFDRTDRRVGDRRHYTPQEGLAHGQVPVDWVPPTPPPADAAATSASPLSALISRHGIAGAPSPRPVPAAPQHIASPSDARTQVDITKHLSSSGAGGEAAAAAPPPPKRLKRKKLTVRLGRTKYEQIQDMADSSDLTYQSILEAAITDFLDKQD